MKICAITNVYNEASNLPTWIRHYRKQVPNGTLLVVDHGSDDGSTDNINNDVSIIRMKRSPFDDNRRSMMIVDLTRSMLREFDAVIYTDADELLIADPRKHKSLESFVESDDRASFTAIGLNVVHRIDIEENLDPNRNWIDQRNYVRFVSPMCKTLITKRPLRWSGGFHYSDAPISFGDLYLFHMRWADLQLNLNRLATTREVEWKRKDHQTYQKSSDEETIERFRQFCKIPFSDREDFLFESEIAQIIERQVEVNSLNRIPQDVRPREIHKIPSWFKSPA